jgi:arylsulfatase A-like enzyme
VTIDTCRDDHVGLRSDGSSLTPNLDALGREGRRIPVAVSTSCFTAPAMTSIATGVYPETHGVLQWGIDGAQFQRPGLAARFRGAGYRTAFVSGHGGLGGIVPLLDGFDFVRDVKDAPAPDVTRLALDWLDRNRREAPSRPFFLWVHYFDPHSPYSPPEPFAGRVLGEISFARWSAETLPSLSREERDSALESLYAGEVAEVDRSIGDLLPSVRRAVPAERLVIAVTADHGENLSDHEPNFAHHDALFDSLVRVPFLLFGPGVAELPLRDRVPVEVLRLAPTLLDLCRVDYRPGDFDRPSLVHGSGDGFAYCHSGLQDFPHAALRSATSKVVIDLSTGNRDGFDLVADPGERRALVVESKEALRSLAGALAELRRVMPMRDPDPRALESLPEELKNWLEELGYVAGRATPKAPERPKNK